MEGDMKYLFILGGILISPLVIAYLYLVGCAVVFIYLAALHIVGVI